MTTAPSPTHHDGSISGARSHEGTAFHETSRTRGDRSDRRRIIGVASGLRDWKEDEFCSKARNTTFRGGVP